MEDGELIASTRRCETNLGLALSQLVFLDRGWSLPSAVLLRRTGPSAAPRSGPQRESACEQMPASGVVASGIPA